MSAASASPANSPAADATTAPAATPDAATLGGELPAANATPAPSPDPGFIQAYEAAYVQFLQEKYDEARELLDKADKIQPGQASAISLRNQIFKHFYSEGYLSYASRDYENAVKHLDSADKVLPNQADSYNMRGLIFSRQKDYPSAEAMFKKAIGLDPTFWEARFNQAELPFIHNNYTEARARFEALLTQTDPVKQPKETELTEFKVFLTLLLEGKEPAARSLMEHFTFTGATPARYYCQAALDFYHGEQDKAMSWVSSARKEYPAKLDGIFSQAFYRVGWFSDANAALLAKASPAAGAVASGVGAPADNSSLLAITTGVPGASPGPTAAEMAMASPAKGPDFIASAMPSRAAASASPAPTAASAANANVAAATPAAPSPAGSPARDVLKVSKAAPAPAATAVAAAPVATTTPAAGTPSASADAQTPQPAVTGDDTGLSASDYLIIGFVAVAFGLNVISGIIVMMAIKKKKARLAKKPLRYGGSISAKPQEAEIS